MRLEDFSDYIRLRRLARNPYEIVRFRHNRDTGAELEVEFRGSPPLFLRGGREDYHMFHRIFLRDEYRLDGLLQRGLGCVLDLGGNVGLFSARVAPHCGQVITCEPVPDNFARLEKNLHGFDNVVRLTTAVSDSKKELRIYPPRKDSSTGAFSAHRTGSEARLSEEFIEVPAVSLEDLMSRPGTDQVDLLKVDVEGAEYEILHAGVHLCPRIKRIHGEYHDVNGDDPRTRIDNFAQFLRDAGYTVDVLRHKKKDNHGMFYASRAG